MLYIGKKRFRNTKISFGMKKYLNIVIVFIIVFGKHEKKSQRTESSILKTLNLQPKENFAFTFSHLCKSLKSGLSYPNTKRCFCEAGQNGKILCFEFMGLKIFSKARSKFSVGFTNIFKVFERFA